MKRRTAIAHGPGVLSGALGGLLVVTLALPLCALALSASPDDIRSGLSHPLFVPALMLSLRTTVASLAIIVLTGTPIAWWFAVSSSRWSRAAAWLVDLPIVIPPAVIGVALLEAFGRRGLLGPGLASLGVSVPFTEQAVVLAQVVVSAPFYVQSASNALRKVDPDLLTVARTLGASRRAAFLLVSIPTALPGLVAGASLAWARSLGEFGATLLFAGNFSGTTQTMPLAIFSALESDVRVAVVLALVLAAIGALLLLLLRVVPRLWRARSRVDSEVV